MREKGSLQRIQENKKRDAGLSDSEAKCGILLCCSAELGHRGRHEKETAAGKISIRAIIKYKMSRPNVQKILYKNVQLICLF